MSSLLIFIIFIFITGIYFCAKYSNPKNIESLVNMEKSSCPNMLIQKGCRFYLYNSKEDKVPGVNPIEFDNLEDYTEFLDWQHKQGIHCPVLYLQQMNDVQGDDVYKVRPGVSDLMGGTPPSKPNNTNFTLLVDATKNDKPYNKNSYPAYDGSPYYIGKKTPLDVMDEIEESKPLSPNAMDSNWGGGEFTQSLVDKGYYADNEVNILVS